MSTQPQVIGTGIIVLGGRWSTGKAIDVRAAIGIGVYALAIAGIAAANPKLASQFASLVLISAGFIYAVPVATKLGIIGAPKAGTP